MASTVHKQVSSSNWKGNITMKNIIASFGLPVAVASTVFAAPVTPNIKMDNFGYRPGDIKVAIFTADPGATVQIRNTSDAIVFTVPSNGGSITSMGADGQP